VIGRLANAIGYQLVWLMSVAGAAHGMPRVGPLAAIGFVLAMFAFGGASRDDLRLIPLVLLLGLFVDSAWIMLGWINFSAPSPSTRFAPEWILGIWLAFAMTLNHSLAFLKRRPAIAALLGAVGGPLAYWSAARGFGVVHFDAPLSIVLPCLAIAWAATLPLLLRIADHRTTAKIIEALP